MAAASDTRLDDRRLAVGVESVEPEVGGGCFRGLVQALAETSGVAYAFLAEPAQPPYLYADRARL